MKKRNNNIRDTDDVDSSRNQTSAHNAKHSTMTSANRMYEKEILKEYSRFYINFNSLLN